MSTLIVETPFDGALREWDAHVDACAICLTDGMNLCYEGLYLSEEVIESRVAVQRGRLGPVPPFRGPRRSLSAGAVA